MIVTKKNVEKSEQFSLASQFSLDVAMIFEFVLFVECLSSYLFASPVPGKQSCVSG